MTDAIICAPMRIEARAIRRGLRASSDPPLVVRTGYGTRRAADRAGELKATSFGQLVVMGVGGGLTAGLAPGDLVVGTEVGAVTCESAPILVGELRRAGLPARAGRIATVDHLAERPDFQLTRTVSRPRGAVARAQYFGRIGAGPEPPPDRAGLDAHGGTDDRVGHVSPPWMYLPRALTGKASRYRW